jgi:hypothetical protein
MRKNAIRVLVLIVGRPESFSPQVSHQNTDANLGHRTFAALAQDDSLEIAHLLN